MTGMDIVLVVILLVAVGAASAFAAVELMRHRPAPTAAAPDIAVQAAVAVALTEMREQAVAERDAAVRAALEQAAIMQREQLGVAGQQVREQTTAELAAKKDLIDSRLDQSQAELRAELAKLGELVNGLANANAEKFGKFDESLRSHAEITRSLSDSTRALREAMASPTARGQWGERMAEDVLRLAGFVENVNYVKQSQLDSATGRPDFTFPLPKGHELYMDVKFPMAAYLRYLDAASDVERQTHRASFLRDVRARVKELARRDYARESGRPSVDYVLLFLPNEQLAGFIHEHDPELLDDAINQRVVMCSPLTLFAFLGVIRQAYDNFMVEQTSDEILSLIGKFGTEWSRYNAQLDNVKKKFEQLDRQFETLVGTRRRQLEKPLRQLEAVRLERNLPVDGELFPSLVDDDELTTDDATPDNIRRLGA